MSRKTTPTYVLLNQITLAATSSSVTFSNIPQNYGDLVIAVDGTISAFDGIGLRFNDDASSSYPTVVMYASGSSPGSILYTGTESGAGILSTGRSSLICNVFDYAASDKYTVVLGRSGAVDTQIRAAASTWNKTSPVTKIAVNAAAGTRTFGIGTTFYLYGLVA